MKKLMLGLMIAFAVTEVGAGVVPGVIIDGLEYSLDTEAKTAAITGYTDEPTEVRVETVYKDGVIYTVTSVEQFAFYCCSSLTSVYLPKVTLIGNHAFGSCASLVTVFLPAVITIKEVAFRDCPLASVSLPAAIVIAESAFYGCSKLSSAFLPNATSIGVQAFYECTSLTTVVMPYVDKIAEKTFVACPLTSISLPNATSIGEDAFYGCSELALISLPNARVIYKFAFEGCSKLTSVLLPSATSIGVQAFSFCASLVSISLPNVTSIGASVFSECSSLGTIYVNKNMKTVLEGDRFEYSIPKDCTIVEIIAPKLTYEEVQQAAYEVREAVLVPVIAEEPSVTLKSNGNIVDESDYAYACEVYNVTPQTKPKTPAEPKIEDCIVVNSMALQAAKAETISIANGAVQLGVSVLSNANIAAEIADWGKVNLSSENVKVENGNVVITIPVSSASGFMILQTKDAAK